MTTRLILVRHGETEWNRQGVFRGRTDLSLNENGFRQCQALAYELSTEGINAVYSGPLKRALQTAELLAEPHHIPVQIEEGLQNINLGEWQGLLKTEAAKKYPDQWQKWVEDTEHWQVQGAETLQDIRNRAIPAVHRITREHPDQVIALVTHRSVLKIIITTLLGLEKGGFWKVYLDNASYSILEYQEKNGFVLITLNRTCHLKEKVTEVF
ncbi:histidine phosphatase family protein [bacterium]|nr:histidine phosphatase family protein [bacterium]